MDVRITIALVVDGKVRAHPLIDKMLLHKSTYQLQMLPMGQFGWKGKLKLPGQLRVAVCFDSFHAVPQCAPVGVGRRRMGRQHDFGMDDMILAGVVMHHAVPGILQFCAAAIGGRRDSGTTSAPLHDFHSGV